MIDVWFLFNLFVPFLEVVIHTKLELLKGELEQASSEVAPLDKHEEEENTLNKNIKFAYLSWISKV